MQAFSHRGVKIEKHRKRWRWRARDHGGKVVVGGGTSAGLAMSSLDEFLDVRALARADDQTAARRPTSVAALCENWYRSKKPFIAPATVQQYGIHIRVHIKPRIGQIDANTIRPLELEIFYGALRWKSAKESHNILRQAFDWGIRNGILVRDSNPCLVVRPSRRSSIDHDGFFGTDDRIRPVSDKDIPTRIELEKLIVDAEARRDPTWWLYLRFAIATGARPGEICALQRKHVCETQGSVRIEWSADRVAGRLKRPKTPSSVRTLHLAIEFFDQIAEVLPGDPEVFLFPSNTRPGARSPLPCWNSWSVKRRLDDALKRTGLRHITPHSFRHYVATELLDLRLSPLQVGRFLGHANDTLVRSLYGNHILDEAQKLIGHAASRLV